MLTLQILTLLFLGLFVLHCTINSNHPPNKSVDDFDDYLSEVRQLCWSSTFDGSTL